MRVLWLKTELLHPLDKGGKIRTYHMLRGLRERAQVTYLTLDDGTATPDARVKTREYSDDLITVRSRAQCVIAEWILSCVISSFRRSTSPSGWAFGRCCSSTT